MAGYVVADTVFVVSTTSDQIIDRIPCGKVPHKIKISSDGVFAYITGNADSSVTRIHIASRTKMGTVTVGAGPRHLDLSTDGARVFVANSASGTVSIVDTCEFSGSCQTTSCDDLLLNPAFESALANWSPYQFSTGWQLDSLYQHSGAYGLEFTFPSGVGYYDASIKSNQFYVFAGIPYEVSWWMREMDTHDTFDPSETILDAVVSLNGVWDANFHPPISDSWQLVHETITFPQDGYASLDFQLHGYATSLNAYFMLDDFCVRPELPIIPDTLRIGQGTECLTSLNPSQLVLPIYLDNLDTIKAGDIPLCYDWSFDPDSVSFVGTRLASMDLKTDSVDVANNSLRILFVADFGGTGTVLPPVDDLSRDIPIAKVYFHLPYECNETWIQAPDTCSVVLAADVISLELIDKFDQPYIPVVVQDSTRVLQYRPGDCDMNQIITISDAVCIISYIFSGGQPACMEASDADCNGIVTISDVVYIINYIFAGGPVPGANCLCSAPPMFAKSALGRADVATTTSTTDNRHIIEVNLESSADIRALQLDFTVTGEVSNVQATSEINQLQLFSGEVESGYRLGLIDLTGTAAIAAGSTKLLTVTYDGTGVLEIAYVIAVDNNAEEMNVSIGSSKLEPSLPDQYSLSQNQPNPFNPSTDISFSLPKADRVRLVVYNILGEEIAVLVDEARSAGIHRVTWDGKDKSSRVVASGVYLYKLVASDFSQSRKMLLLK